MLLSICEIEVYDTITMIPNIIKQQIKPKYLIMKKTSILICIFLSGILGLSNISAAAADKIDISKLDISKEIGNYPDSGSLYLKRASILSENQLYSEAIDDLLHALTRKEQNKAVNGLAQIAETNYELVVSKIVPLFILNYNVETNNNLHFYSYWFAYVFLLSGHTNESIPFFDYLTGEINDLGLNKKLSQIHYDLGNFEKSAFYLNKILSDNPDDKWSRYNLGRAYYESGDTSEALFQMNELISLDSLSWYAYYYRGWININLKNYEDAIKDFTHSIDLNPSSAYNYLSRADSYAALGNKEMAEADYKKVIELDSVPKEYDTAFYGFLALGDTAKAVSAIDSALLYNDQHFDAACLYGRMGDKEKALLYLRKAMDNGFYRFHHVSLDDDLDIIRDMPEYKDIIDKYKSIYNEKQKSYLPTYRICMESNELDSITKSQFQYNSILFTKMTSRLNESIEIAEDFLKDIRHRLDNHDDCEKYLIALLLQSDSYLSMEDFSKAKTSCQEAIDFISKNEGFSIGLAEKLTDVMHDINESEKIAEFNKKIDKVVPTHDFTSLKSEPIESGKSNFNNRDFRQFSIDDFTICLPAEIEFEYEDDNHTYVFMTPNEDFIFLYMYFPMEEPFDAKERLIEEAAEMEWSISDENIVYLYLDPNYMLFTSSIGDNRTEGIAVYPMYEKDNIGLFIFWRSEGKDNGDQIFESFRSFRTVDK